MALAGGRREKNLDLSHTTADADADAEAEADTDHLEKKTKMFEMKTKLPWTADADADADADPQVIMMGAQVVQGCEIPALSYADCILLSQTSTFLGSNSGNSAAAVTLVGRRVLSPLLKLQ